MGSLDVCHILYTQPIRASTSSLDSSYTAGPLFLSDKPTLVAPYAGHPLELITAMAALSKT